MELISHIFAVQLLVLIITVTNSHILPNEALRRDMKNVTLFVEAQELLNRTRRTAATTEKDRLWDQGIIPYEFENIFTESQKRLIKKAMREWERSTCITFVERIPRVHPTFLQFTKLDCGCCFTYLLSFLQLKHISLQSGCLNLPTILHELGHAIGFEHEHNRPDRDEYVYIIGQNINPECGGTLLESSGSFGPPMNPNGSLVGTERCEWRIRAARGETIELYITALSIYESPDCAIDYLEIKNHYWANSSILARYCGDSYTAYVIAGNYLQLTYVKTSDPSTYSSFRADYKAICGGDIDIEKDTPLIIESTNYPDPYPPNRRCIWYFTAPDNHRIVIKINYFALEMTDDCKNDFLEIRDGNVEHAALIGLYCGIKNSWQVKSTNNTLSVVFGSNEMNQNNGFSATLTALPINS